MDSDNTPETIADVLGGPQPDDDSTAGVPEPFTARDAIELLSAMEPVGTTLLEPSDLYDHHIIGVATVDHYVRAIYSEQAVLNQIVLERNVDFAKAYDILQDLKKMAGPDGEPAPIFMTIIADVIGAATKGL